VTRTRNTDPDVCRIAGTLGPLKRYGAPPEVIEETRAELDRAKRLARIRAAVRNAPPLTSEQLDDIVGMLRTAGGA
jgi:hypothetical protein